MSGSPSAARLGAGGAARRGRRPGSSRRRRRASSGERGQRLERRRAGVGVEVAAGDEVVGQAPGLVEGPGLEGGDELALVDQAVLKREQSEEEMAVGGGSSWRDSGHSVVPDSTGHGTAPEPGRGEGIESGVFSHESTVRAYPTVQPRMSWSLGFSTDRSPSRPCNSPSLQCQAFHLVVDEVVPVDKFQFRVPTSTEPALPLLALSAGPGWAGAGPV